MCGWDVPLPIGEKSEEGAVPVLENFFDFRAQKGVFWCIMVLFLQLIIYLELNANWLRPLSGMQLTGVFW